MGLADLTATGPPPLLSYQRAIPALGALVLAGSGTPYIVAFVSVWCFCAGAASVVLLFHFASAPRRQLVLHQA